MPKCLFVGGKIIWPLLLSSVAARAVLSLVASCRPAGGESPEENTEADLEALMCVIVNLVNQERLAETEPPILKWQEREGKVLSSPTRLFKASRKRSHVLTDTRRAVWG